MKKILMFINVSILFNCFGFTKASAFVFSKTKEPVQIISQIKETDKPVDLDKMAQQAKWDGIIGGITLIAAQVIAPLTLSPIVLLVGGILAFLFAISAVFEAKIVLKNVLATNPQRKAAKVGRLFGVIVLISVSLFLLTIVAFIFSK